MKHTHNLLTWDLYLGNTRGQNPDHACGVVFEDGSYKLSTGDNSHGDKTAALIKNGATIFRGYCELRKKHFLTLNKDTDGVIGLLGEESEPCTVKTSQNQRKHVKCENPQPSTKIDTKADHGTQGAQKSGISGVSMMDLYVSASKR